MAKICGMEAGAGEGNRTLVVSLGSVRFPAFPPFFGLEDRAQSSNKPRFMREHRRVLPQPYRALSRNDLSGVAL